MFDIKGKKYRKQIEKSKKKLKNLQSGSNSLISANTLLLAKTAIDAIRNKFQLGELTPMTR